MRAATGTLNLLNEIMRVLIACEESQVVCIEFRKKGHEAFSCDLQECSGGHPEWHIKQDILLHLNNGWDLMIAHPECKYLCFSGERWIKEKHGRAELRKEAFEFFKKLWNAPIKKIAIENSHSIFLNKNFSKPNQTVHPYHFGDPFKKSICLWLKGLPPLVPTNILPIGQRHPAAWLQSPGKNRSKIRSKTYLGFAKAMAEQWG